MKNVKIIVTLIGLLVLTSFSFNDSAIEKNIVGIYGEANMLELIVKDDHTYQYIQVKHDKKIEVTGEWRITNNTLNLIDQSPKHKILNSWTIENNGGSLKTKKGLTTYTLVKHCK